MKKNVGDTRRKKNRFREVLFAAAAALFLSGCGTVFPWNGGKPESTPAPEKADTGFVVPGPESYDSADTAILTDRNEEENTVTFLNLDLGRKYTLSMDGTTRLYDKYGEAITIGQIQKGDIVDVTFLKSRKHLTTMCLSTQSWGYSDVVQYEINTGKGEVTIGDELYKLTSNTQYLSQGRNIELMDLNAADVLSFQGIGSQVLSVRVERGHGYLRLTNDENFVGGWIEVGDTLIQRITEDMLLLVPEGNYRVSISNKGGGGVKDAQILRNEETVLDIGDLEIPEPQTGMVLFSLTPSDARLYIDGEEADASGPVTLEYGLHQLIVRAEGYQSITQYIRVAQESASFDIVMEAVEAEGGEDESSTESDSSSQNPVTDYYKVYIDAPEGAEVYLDGHYVGIVPCSFRKSEGSHVIILRKEGHETRSYTVQIDDSDKDMSYSFADLVKYGGGKDDGESSPSPSPSPSPDPSTSPDPQATPTPTPTPEPTPIPEPSPDPEPTPEPGA